MSVIDRILTGIAVAVMVVALFGLIGGALQVTGVWPGGPRPIGVCE